MSARARSPTPRKHRSDDEVRTSFATTRWRRDKMQSMLFELGVSQSEFLDACVESLASGRLAGTKIGIRIDIKVKKK